MPCAPSPPSTFCQEKVTTSSLAKSRFCAKAAEVASQMVRPLRSAGMKSPFGTRTPEVVPFQVKTTSRSKSTCGEIGQLAIGRLDGADVGELQLLDHIGHPAVAEAFPGEHVDAARAEQRPHRHLDGAGVGGRHDADAVVGRHLQHFAGQVDRLLRAWSCRSWRGASGRAAAFCSASSDQPGRLAQGPEEKLGFAGRSPGLVSVVIVVYPSR